MIEKGIRLDEETVLDQTSSGIAIVKECEKGDHLFTISEDAAYKLHLALIEKFRAEKKGAIT